VLRRRCPRLLLAGALAALAGCRGAASEEPPSASSPVVATWSDGVLTAADVRAKMATLPAPDRARLEDPARKREMVDHMITNRLLFAEGRRRGYADDPEIVRQVETLRERLVVQRLMSDLRRHARVSSAEARRYYEDNLSLYATTRVRASHILLADETTAEAVYDELLRHPERFATLAREKSIDQTSAKRGGDLGTFGAGQMVPAFERAAFALQPGDVSPPVHTRYGWHVIRVTERHDGPTQPFESVKKQIVALLANRKVEERVEATIGRLQRAAGVRIDEEQLGAVEPPPGGAPPSRGLAGSH
jgi:peptidyl-prolyl cis-trans isomerase C